MLSLKDRLFTAEDEFLAALMKGSEGIYAFYERWEALVLDLESTLDLTNPDPELASLAHTVASRCATLAETSADLLSRNDTLSQELIGELDSLMSELTIHDSQREPSLQPRGVETFATRGSSVSGKRRRLSEEPSEFDPQHKRRRSASERELKSSPISSHLSRMSSPSFSPSPSTSLPNHTSSPTPSTRQSRKRRLSGADICSPVHTSKRFHVGPRLHAVSDSFLIQRGEELETRSPSAWQTVCKHADHSPPDVTSLLDLSAFHDLCAPVAMNSLPVVEVPSADIHERSFWPSSTTDAALSDLECLDTFLRSLLYSDEDVIAFPPPPPPSTSCSLDSQKGSLSPSSYSLTPPRYTPLVNAPSRFKGNDDTLLDVPPLASTLFALAPLSTGYDATTSTSPASDPPSPYVDPQDWQCVFDTLDASLGDSSPSYPDSSSSESDDEVPTPRTISPVPLDSKAETTLSFSEPSALENMSIVIPPFMTLAF